MKNKFLMCLISVATLSTLVLGCVTLPTAPIDLQLPVAPIDIPSTVSQPTEEILLLENYDWEDSDDNPGYSYIMPAATIRGKVVMVNETSFVYDLLWHDGREVWYGPIKSSFPTGSCVTIKTVDGKSYSTNTGSVTTTPPYVPPQIGVTIEKLHYHGRHNGDRPTWYGADVMVNYPRTLTVTIPNCVTRTITHDGNRYDRNSLIVKQSDVSGRGLAVIYSSSCKSTTATISY